MIRDRLNQEPEIDFEQFKITDPYQGSCGCDTVKYEIDEILLALWCFCDPCYERSEQEQKFESPFHRTSSSFVTPEHFTITDGIDSIIFDHRVADSGNDNFGVRCENDECPSPYIFHSTALEPLTDGKITKETIAQIPYFRVKRVLEDLAPPNVASAFYVSKALNRMDVNQQQLFEKQFGHIPFVYATSPAPNSVFLAKLRERLRR